MFSSALAIIHILPQIIPCRGQNNTVSVIKFISFVHGHVRWKIARSEQIGCMKGVDQVADVEQIAMPFHALETAARRPDQVAEEVVVARYQCSWEAGEGQARLPVQQRSLAESKAERAERMPV